MGYSITWREGQLRPLNNQNMQNGAPVTQDFTLETNPDTHEFHKIESIGFKSTGGQGVFELFVNERKTAVIEYNGAAHYHIEINPHGKVQISSSSHKNHEKIDIKDHTICEFLEKLDKHHFKV